MKTKRKAAKESAKDWCYLPLRDGYKVKIDREDYERVAKHTWRVLKKDSGRLKVVTAISTPQGTRVLSLGQFLMNPPKGQMAYPRRFMEGLDYRKSNLIVCTMQERQRMLPKSRNHGTSKYKGVSYISSQKVWRATIRVDQGRTIRLGNFKSEIEAAAAYNKASKEHFGDLGYQNPLKPRPKRKRDGDDGNL